MKIREVEDKDEIPFCKYCKVPLWFECKVFTDEQIEIFKREEACEHEIPRDIVFDSAEYYCIKCGYRPLMLPREVADLYRCRLCCKLFKVEGSIK